VIQSDDTMFRPRNPAAAPDRRHLLAAIHDVGPLFESEVDRLRDLLLARLPEDRVAMLVVPCHWGRAPIVPGSPFARRLRAWAEAGTEMFVHGWFHKDDSFHIGATARFKARHLTASEGEFLGLGAQAARERMEAGRSLIEEVTGRPVAGFVAPAWLYGRGAMRAAAEAGFALCEDHFRVWQPASGLVVGRGPVISWASRSRTRIAASIASAFLLRQALRPAPLVRVAVHPGDTGIPALLASIDRTLASLTRSRQPIRYADLLPVAVQ
jgi:predicted deacetylase